MVESEIRQSLCASLTRAKGPRHWHGAAPLARRAPPESAVAARKLALPAQSDTITGHAQVWSAAGSEESVGHSPKGGG